MARVVAVALALASCWPALAVEQDQYYAHPTVLDDQGVIAPWYSRQNGQCDLRVRIAAETLKRYPWCGWSEAARPAPEYVPSGAWQISPEGVITIPKIGDWENGDLGQRAAYLLSGLADYYRYSGDAAAIAQLYATADYLVECCLTPPDHPWPGILISVPNKGKPYGRPDPHGFIQLDIVAEAGIGLLRAYQVTGETRWLEAARHWGDLLAEKRSRGSGAPWGRYANPEDVPWGDIQTGGVVFIIEFFDELIRLGHRGEANALLAARADGIAYLRDSVLPRWTSDDTFGRNYWDWEDPVQAENVTEFVVRYLMKHPDEFPNWRADCRNILTLFLNRTSVAPSSNGDVYSGAWAYPESSGCCGRSLWYGPMELAMVYGEYAARAGSEWAREMARRQMTLATYDIHETGVVEDNIDGGFIVAGAWFKIAHPMALKHVLGAMAWLPDVFGAGRENHIMRSTAVVRNVAYADGRVDYETFDAPAGTQEVLRLAFRPESVAADGARLPLRPDLRANGYMVDAQPNGDYLVTVRHDGLTSVRVAGDGDPSEAAGDAALSYEGEWVPSGRAGDSNGTAHRSAAAGATMTLGFTGNQVRVLGRYGPMGGRADVLLDGEKQLVGIDTWLPQTRYQQVLYYRNGLPNGTHTVRIVVRGEGNPLSAGKDVVIDGAEWSAAEGAADSGSGRGPAEPQRWIFGYPKRQPYVDAAGHEWLPATEVVIRSVDLADAVKQAWWTEPRLGAVQGTDDPELYRYGIHAPLFTAYFTVAPGVYHARVRLAETRRTEAIQRALTIRINGKDAVVGLDIAATAGGVGRACDLVFNGLSPEHGVIAVQFRAAFGGEAIAQAIELAPGRGGEGATPVWLDRPTGDAEGNLLSNPGFENGVASTLGRLGQEVDGVGWKHLFLCADQAYLWGESGYAIHPDWGLPEIRTGKEALRTHAERDGHTLAYQDAPVEPRKTYRASVWVRAVDLHGSGFGTHPGDAASLRIQELGVCGKVFVDHPAVRITDAGPYRELAFEFTTGPTTAMVRFILDTTIAAPYNEGHVTYDDAALTAVDRR